jgi:hypothetical protein
MSMSTSMNPSTLRSGVRGGVARFFVLVVAEEAALCGSLN